MHQTGDWHMRIFAARIRHIVGRTPSLLDPRNDLSANRVVGTETRNQIEEVWSNRKRQLGPGQQNAVPFFGRELQMLFKVSQARHPILELPFPIVPEFSGDIRPVSWRMRNELFSILTNLMRGHFVMGKNL